jgi:hypothetical protein
MHEGGGSGADGEGSMIPPPLCLPQHRQERRQPGGGVDGTCKHKAVLDTCAPPLFPPPLPAFCVYPIYHSTGGVQDGAAFPPSSPAPFVQSGMRQHVKGMPPTFSTLPLPPLACKQGGAKAVLA